MPKDSLRNDNGNYEHYPNASVSGWFEQLITVSFQFIGENCIMDVAFRGDKSRYREGQPCAFQRRQTLSVAESSEDLAL